LLTLAALRAAKVRNLKVVLMGTGRADASTASNGRMLRELGSPAILFSLDYLGRACASRSGVWRHARQARRVLADIVRPGTAAEAWT
jgi:hypothetical protein